MAADRRTLAGTLDVIAADLPPALVGAEAWRRARGVAERLPAALARAFYLECRLRPAAPQVDWIVRIDPRERDLIAGRDPWLRLGAEFQADDTWTRLARLCAAWADDPMLRAVVSHLWLEFDLDAADGAVPRPSVFVGFDAAATRSLAEDGWSGVLGRLLGILRPGAGASRTRAAMEGAIARRPAGAGIPYLGVMLARPEPVVRLYLTGLAAATLPNALRDAGWPGDAGELAALLEVAGGGAAPRIQVAHVDAHEGMLPGVGVEYALRTRGPAEAAFLDRLVELGFCAAAKRRALDEWPGRSVQVLRHELWASRVTRRVNHVKLLCAPGRPSEAKGYLLTSCEPAARRRREAPALAGSAA